MLSEPGHFLCLFIEMWVQHPLLSKLTAGYSSEGGPLPQHPQTILSHLYILGEERGLPHTCLEDVSEPGLVRISCRLTVAVPIPKCNSHMGTWKTTWFRSNVVFLSLWCACSVSSGPMASMPKVGSAALATRLPILTGPSDIERRGREGWKEGGGR